LAAFGETSISACNDSHSSQATATLGNTPNLNIGSYDKETPTLVPTTGNPTTGFGFNNLVLNFFATVSFLSEL